MWAFFHKLGSPRWFYGIAARLAPWCWGLALALIVVGSVWGLAFAPSDYQQGNSFRIIYVHVPAAFLAQSIFIALAASGFVFMVWKVKIADMAAAMMAPLGAAMTAIALLSGSVWGKPTWGTWWQWDARLTSMLILLFLYVGVMLIRRAFPRPLSGSKAASVLAMVGVINIPIIKYSVEWWNTLHQPASFTLTERPAMPTEMWLPLLIMVLGFYAFFAAFTLTRTRTEILRREGSKRWVKELFKEDA
ncbi:heme ABC transporter permease [Halomonas denitrificans]|uniref:heme ABC transporter permease n=1 Tax=Halomonas TaxID=2745 RepID=UPI001A8D4CEB|nr:MULTISPECIES: heme ABC transporter permease [Halomonas]MBN8411756.1 heme ABC transporter permease [Halomonas litopenaei]MBY5927879.1 heme ABC transporter permease [Halomonas sp. DP8Y7-3]MBY5967570.1 heme ABC transporter permease [Halomonas denitrificans]MBY5983074.1 heme ABC transporter permease [Halomonas sp. DP5Y7-2]MBY6028924.1 heme ABC transporter permease [Halomonas sp. DP8Y7-1]